MNWRRIEWHIRQLLPLTYRSEYGIPSNGTRHFVVWNMWMGRCYNVRDVVIAPGS